jgi:antitoxin HigA-1
MRRKRDAVPSWKIHPGEILREEFLKPMNLSVNELARSLHVPAPRINDIVLERRGITADTAVRLARFFDVSEEFWMNLQLQYEVRAARQRLRRAVRKIQPLRSKRVA